MDRKKKAKERERTPLLDKDIQTSSKAQQPWQRDKTIGLGKISKVNSEFIFNNKELKKNTKGYDKLTGEIDKRGKPADNQQEIFVKKPEPELTQAEKIKERDKKDAKKREALNKKLYKDRLATKWDRGW
jgi:hypothetical protein